MTQPRLDGLDLARFVAFVGMVIVNFQVVMGAHLDAGFLSDVTASIEGRAAATFVVLAGIGLGLAARQSEFSQTMSVSIRRAAFLLVIGLLNSLIFEADILHYYAFYFLFGVLLLPLRTRWLVLSIVLLNLAFFAMLIFFDYESGWNWEELSYAGFWTGPGFVRNLFFNGWHPVFPWLGFLLLGIALSRPPLSAAATQHRLILWGVAAVTISKVAGDYFFDLLASADPELAIIATTSPIPPMPLFVLAAIYAALWSRVFRRGPVEALMRKLAA